MAAENKTGDLYCLPAVAEGQHESVHSASQGKSSVWLSGAPVAQSHTTSSSQAPVIGTVSFQNVPTVPFTGHLFAVCAAKSVSTTTSSFSPYTCRTTHVSSIGVREKGSVFVNPVPQQQSIVSATSVPTVRLAAQPTAVLDLSNNGNVLNTVLGRLPNLGTMVVHQLAPGSVVQKNVLAMIDRTPIVTTATAVINMQPGLSLSYQGTLAMQPPRQVTTHTVCPVTQASRVQPSMQSVIINQIPSREPLVACSLTAKQPVALPQSSAAVSNTLTQFTPVNLPAAKPTVMVRTLPNASGRTRFSLSVAPFGGSRISSTNSAEIIPQIKLPHTASSLPDAIVHCHTTASVQPIPVVLGNQPMSKMQHNVSSLPMQTQLATTVPSTLTSLSGNAISGFNNTMSSSTTLSQSISSTTIISLMPPFAILQSDVKAKSAADSMTVVASATQLPGNTAEAVCQTGVQASAAHLAASLIQIPTCTHVPSSSALSTQTVFMSSVPQLPFARFPSPPATLLRGQHAKTKKRSVKRAPRNRTDSGPVFSSPTSATHPNLLGRVFRSSAPATCLTNSTAPVALNTLPHGSSAHPSTSTLMAGVKRKCVPAQKYTLLLENGCTYSSVYFDGLGFQAKKRAVSSVLTGNCYYQ